MSSLRDAADRHQQQQRQRQRPRHLSYRLRAGAITRPPSPRQGLLTWAWHQLSCRWCVDSQSLKGSLLGLSSPSL